MKNEDEVTNSMRRTDVISGGGGGSGEAEWRESITWGITNDARNGCGDENAEERGGMNECIRER